MPASSKLVALCLCVSPLLMVRGENDSAFPGGVRPLFEKLQAVSRKYTVDQQDQAVVQELRQRSQKKLSQASEDEQLWSALAEAAYAKVHERVLRLKFVGGCPRQFNDCPDGWEANGNICSPSADYDGLCEAFDHAAFEEKSVQEQEAFAVECRLSWPCTPSCARDFSGCPESWQSSSGACMAPGTYEGMCSTTTRFSGYSSRQKADWASLCDATWPCVATTARAVSFLASKSMPVDAYKIRNSIPLTVCAVLHPFSRHKVLSMHACFLCPGRYADPSACFRECHHARGHRGDATGKQVPRHGGGLITLLVYVLFGAPWLFMLPGESGAGAQTGAGYRRHVQQAPGTRVRFTRAPLNTCASSRLSSMVIGKK